MNSEISLVNNTFALCFLSVIWRRILITVSIYCQYKKISMNTNIVLKCLKYNILSPTGIGYNFKRYFIKTLKVGFLMPEDYKEEKYVEKAIKLFCPVYHILNKGKEIEFIQQYSSVGFQKPDEIEKETKDVLLKYDCKELCNLIDLWDINLGLISTDDPYQKFLLYGILSIFNTYSHETDTGFIF